MARRALLAAFLIIALSATARAEPTVGGTYQIKGRIDGQDLDGSVNFVPKDAAHFAVVVTERRDGKPQVTWTSEATLSNRLLKWSRPDDQAGLTDGVAGSEKQASRFEYVALFEDSGFQRAHVVVYRATRVGARTRDREIGAADLSRGVAIGMPRLGELGVWTRDKIRELMIQGSNTTKEYDFADDYLHVALGGGARLLADGERTGFMKGADEETLRKEQRQSVWVETTVNGGPRFGKEFEHDLIESGALSVKTSFSFERGIRYTLVDQYPKDKTVAKELLERPFTAFRLPLDAEKARAMPLGQQRTFEGYANVLLSGTLVFGQDFKELFKDYEELKLDAEAGVTWRHSGNLKLFVERQFNDLVRVRWTRSSSRDIGAQASVVFGLLRNQDKLDELSLPVNDAVEAAMDKTEGRVTIQFSVGADWIREHSLDVDMTFDLSTEQGRAGYEAALAGDLREVEALAKTGAHPGLRKWKRTDTASKALTTQVAFSAFSLLRYERSTETRDTRVVVESLNGSSLTDAYDHSKHTDGTPFRRRRSEDLTAHAVYKEVTPKVGEKARAVQFEVTFERDDPRTDQGGWADRFALARTIFGGEVLAPPFAQDAKRVPTHTRFEAAFGPDAIQRILAVDDATFFSAYARACTDGGYAWTPAAVRDLKALDLTDPKNDGRHDEIARAKDAWTALDQLHRAARADGRPSEQMKRFRDLAKREGFKLHAVVAMVLVTTRDDSRVALTISSGDQVLFDREEGKTKDLPEDP